MQNSIDPRTSALLLLHWQNELVKPGGAVDTPFPQVLSAAGRGLCESPLVKSVALQASPP